MTDLSKIENIMWRMPVRLKMLLLGAFVLVPFVLLLSKLFPSLDRQEIAVIFAFAMAAAFAFPIFR